MAIHTEQWYKEREAFNNAGMIAEKTFSDYIDNYNSTHTNKQLMLYCNNNPNGQINNIDNILMTSGSTVTLSTVELKGRNIEIDQYSNGMCEYEKIEHLQNTANDNVNAFLIAIYYPSSKMAIWKIDKHKEYNYLLIPCRNHTVKDDGKKLKKIVYLPMSEAKIFDIDTSYAISVQAKEAKKTTTITHQKREKR